MQFYAPNNFVMSNAMCLPHTQMQMQGLAQSIEMQFYASNNISMSHAICLPHTPQWIETQSNAGPRLTSPMQCPHYQEQCNVLTSNTNAMSGEIDRNAMQCLKHFCNVHFFIQFLVQLPSVHWIDIYFNNGYIWHHCKTMQYVQHTCSCAVTCITTKI